MLLFFMITSGLLYVLGGFVAVVATQLLDEQDKDNGPETEFPIKALVVFFWPISAVIAIVLTLKQK